MQALELFGPDIWIADGPSVNVLGPITMPTRMVVVKLVDGSLWINSPVAATVAEMQNVSKLGPVRYLVAPTRMHAWRLAAWKASFPDASLWGPPPRTQAPTAWTHDLDQVVFCGNALLDEVEFLHRPSRTLIVADFVQNYPAQPRRPLLNVLVALGGALDGGVPRDIRLSFTNRSEARASLRTMLSWDFDRLIVGHGQCVRSGAKAFVEAAFSWLLGP